MRSTLFAITSVMIFAGAAYAQLEDVTWQTGTRSPDHPTEHILKKGDGTTLDGSALVSGSVADFSAYNIIIANNVANDSTALKVEFANDWTDYKALTYNIGALTVKDCTSAALDGIYVYARDSAAVLNVLGDLSFDNATVTTKFGGNFNAINIGTGANGGNLSVKNSTIAFGGDGTAINNGDDTLNPLNSSVINGSIKILGTSAKLSTSVGKTTLASIGSHSAPDFKVKGIVDMQAATSAWVYNNSTVSALYGYTEIGGLSGAGTLSSVGAAGSKSVIAFNPAKKTDSNEFKGSINSNAQELSLEKFGMGTQILRLTDNNFASTLTVNEGTMLLSNSSKVTNAKLILNGGTFGAAIHATDTTKKAYFDNITWNGGKLLFDISKNGTNTIISKIYANTANFAGDEFLFEFNVSPDVDLSATIFAINEFFIISKVNQLELLELLSAGKFKGVSSDGLWAADFASTIGAVKFIAIPEASTTAAFFGAFALVAVLIRRRK